MLQLEQFFYRLGHFDSYRRVAHQLLKWTNLRQFELFLAQSNARETAKQNAPFLRLLSICPKLTHFKVKLSLEYCTITTLNRYLSNITQSSLTHLWLSTVGPLEHFFTRSGLHKVKKV